MNEELRNKDNLIVYLLKQLFKKTECITTLNNKFSNNATDNNNNNNDNLSHKNNSHVKKKNNHNNSNNSNNNNNNNNNNENNNNNNNNNTLNIDNHARHVNNTRNTVLILGDSIAKNINGYLLAKKLQNKKLIKVRSFRGVKLRCMFDHVKPTIREFNPNHMILHVELKNELKSSKTANQILK